MSVESEILRIQHNIASAYAKVAEKGGEVPSQPNSANLAAAVQTIPQGETYIAGDGIDITETAEGPKIGVTTPVQGIVTQAEFDALTEAQQSKGLYVISDGGDGGDGGASAGEVYSTEETRIGTWIDGKPIYRVVLLYSYNKYANDFERTVDISALNVENLVTLRATTYDSRGMLYVSGYCKGASQYFSARIAGGKIYLSGGGIGAYIERIYITFEYTKTTDEGGTA